MKKLFAKTAFSCGNPAEIRPGQKSERLGTLREREENPSFFVERNSMVL